MKKIAFILTPVDFGGAEKVSLNFLKYIDRNEFDVCPIVLVRPWENSNVFIEKIEKHNFQYLTIPVAIKPLSEGRDYLRVIRCFMRLFSILRRERFDLVHTNGYFADMIGIPLSRLLRIPTISTCHGFIENERKLRIYNALDLLALRFSTKVICVSSKIRRHLIRSGVRRNRTLLFQNAVGLSGNGEFSLQEKEKTRKLVSINEDEVILGFIGRLSEEKGLRYLIEACSRLSASGLPLKVVMVGDGPDKSELEKLANDRGLKNKVIFTGFQKDVTNWLTSMDIFVLPSLTEGTPMALLEAMAAGIPIIASAVGGVPEVIDSGVNGILVSPAQPEEIAKAVLTVCENDSFRKRLSEAARETIRNRFSLEMWVKKIEDTYIEMLGIENR